MNSVKQYPLPLPHQVAMGADDFMVTDSNREAAAWLDKWPEWPSHCMVIYGPSGSGKTHLSHVWQNQSKAYTATISELVVKGATTLCAMNKVLLLDNADKVTGDSAAEEALFHLYNHLREIKGYMLLTAQLAPAQWDIRLPDLKSRLSSIPAVALAAPDDALLAGLLIKQFRDRQIDIGMDVVDYLIPRLSRTPEAIRSFVAAMDSESLAEKRGLTVALARKILEQLSHDL